MNERIKLLAEQAGIDFFNSTDPEYFGRVYCEGWSEQQQKFAELIAQESIVDFYRRYLDICSEEDITVQVERYVKEHFGVEE